VDRFGIPNPRKSGSVIWADRQRSVPSCVLLKRMPQGRTESGGIVLAANAGPRVPRGGVTLKRRCTHRPSVIYLIVNKLLSLSLSLSLSTCDPHQCVRGRGAQHLLKCWPFMRPAGWVSTLCPQRGQETSDALRGGGYMLSYEEKEEDICCHMRLCTAWPMKLTKLFYFFQIYFYVGKTEGHSYRFALNKPSSSP